MTEIRLWRDMANRTWVAKVDGVPAPIVISESELVAAGIGNATALVLQEIETRRRNAVVKPGRHDRGWPRR